MAELIWIAGAYRSQQRAAEKKRGRGRRLFRPAWLDADDVIKAGELTGNQAVDLGDEGQRACGHEQLRNSALARKIHNMSAVTVAALQSTPQSSTDASRKEKKL